MLKLLRFIFISFLISTISSCILFTSESDFYFMNETSHILSVSWVNDEDKNETLIVQTNETKLLKNSVMGESDDIKPSFVFKSLHARANISGVDIIVYNQNPINNSIWQKTSANKDRYYIYTLKLTDSDLSLP